jgi:hypothetical protein
METNTTYATKKRGPKNKGLKEQVHVQVTPDLKAWLAQQPEDASALVRALIEQERKRRSQDSFFPQ